MTASPPITELTCDAAVVGAGLAGLVAARELQRAGLEAIVLEARDRVGGRLWNHSLPGGGVVELGGQFVGPTQDRIAALADDLGVDTFPTFVAGEMQASVAGRADLRLASGSVAGIVSELDALAAELPLDAPWEAPRAREWDAQTLHTWLTPRVQDPAVAALLALVVSAVFTAEADELSLLHVLAYIRSAGTLGLLTAVEGGAQESRFVGGSQLVAIRLAEQLGAGVVRLDAPVRRIRQHRERVVLDAAGLLVRARRVVVATPLALTGIAHEPPLPARRVQLQQRAAPGATIKVHAVYERPFWREQGLNGRVITDEGHVTVTFDNSPPSGTPGVLVAFVEADAARDFEQRAAAERRALVLAALVRFFGPAAGEPIEYVETNWAEQEWTRGCYGANFGPGAWTRYGDALRAPVGRVHWAGAETSPVWMNYMDGAVRSGERAAAEVVAALAAEPVAAA